MTAAAGTGTDFRKALEAYSPDVIPPGAVPEPVVGHTNLALLRIPRGCCLVKRHWFLDASRAPLLEKILAALAAENLVPPVLTAQDGRLLVRTSDGFFSVMERIDVEGGDIPLSEAGSLVARMHRVLARHDAKGIPSPMAGDPAETIRLLKEEGLGEGEGLLQAAETASRNIRVQSVHNDLHPGNFLRERGGRLIVSDLDSFSGGFSIVDALFAAFRLGQGRGAAIETFLGSYTATRSLSETELRLGPLLLAADFLRKIGFILRRSAAGDSLFLKDLPKYRGYFEGAKILLRERGERGFSRKVA